MPGQIVSLLPMGRCERVWASELAWPLAGEPRDVAGRQGISNRATASALRLRVEGGAREIDAAFTPGALSPELAALRERIVTALAPN